MNLVEELQRAIEQWMRSRRNGNLSVLSRLSGVSYPTLRRIMQAEFTPNLETVMQVVAVIFDDRDGRDFLCRHFPDFAPIFRKTEDVTQEALGFTGLSQSFGREEFVILNLANGHGVSVSRLNKKLGEQAGQAIRRLLQADLIEQTGDIIRSKMKNLSFTNAEAVLHHMVLAIQNFNRDKMNAFGSNHALFSERLSAEGIEIVNQAVLEAKRRLVEVFNDPKYVGDEPYMTVLSAAYLD